LNGWNIAQQLKTIGCENNVCPERIARISRAQHKHHAFLFRVVPLADGIGYKSIILTTIL
jgi:hypothetical protein